jgi:hypothetical protein
VVLHHLGLSIMLVIFRPKSQKGVFARSQRLFSLSQSLPAAYSVLGPQVPYVSMLFVLVHELYLYPLLDNSFYILFWYDSVNEFAIHCFGHRSHCFESNTV